MAMAVTYRRHSRDYRGYLLELVGDEVIVYDGRQAVYSAHKYWDGENGWRKCRKWVDARVQGQPCVQEMEHRDTALGQALYIRVYTNNYRQLPWSEVWDTFQDRYPGQWAVQMFPPKDQVVDEENIYHLFVLEEPPAGLNIKRDKV